LAKFQVQTLFFQVVVVVVQELLLLELVEVVVGQPVLFIRQFQQLLCQILAVVVVDIREMEDLEWLY
jgi:hypothetical protein